MGKSFIAMAGTDHTCHWPGCTKKVPPRMWGCGRHWNMLPEYIRDAIWNAYVPGQEVRKDPSPAYLRAAQAARHWIVKHDPMAARFVSRPPP